MVGPPRPIGDGECLVGRFILALVVENLRPLMEVRRSPLVSIYVVQVTKCLVQGACSACASGGDQSGEGVARVLDQRLFRIGHGGLQPIVSLVIRSTSGKLVERWVHPTVSVSTGHSEGFLRVSV